VANWLNIRLAVYGSHAALLRFTKRAPITKPSRIFPATMLEGESGHLLASRVRSLSVSLSKKVYMLQLRNDDGLAHFTAISAIYPNVKIVLIYFDPNTDSSGSYLIHSGDRRHYKLALATWESLLQVHKYNDDDDAGDGPYWEAASAAIDICEKRWESVIVRGIRIGA
jgi:hypothetical protein